MLRLRHCDTYRGESPLACLFNLWYSVNKLSEQQLETDIASPFQIFHWYSSLLVRNVTTVSGIPSTLPPGHICPIQGFSPQGDVSSPPAVPLHDHISGLIPITFHLSRSHMSQTLLRPLMQNNKSHPFTQKGLQISFIYVNILILTS